VVKFANPISNQRGVALPLVLILLVVITILGVAAINISEGNTSLIGRFVGGEKALYNAEKGYNQYLWRLNDNPDFYKDSSKFDCDQTSDSNYHIYTPKDKSADTNNNFRLQIRVPLIDVGGKIQPAQNQVVIRSTGWPKNNTQQMRTIEVELFKRTFTQYMMISNSDTDSKGDPVKWRMGDRVYGPIHSNKEIHVDLIDIFDIDDMPVFYGLVTYKDGIVIYPKSYDWAASWLGNDPLYDPRIFRQGHQQLAKGITFPPGNTELRALAKIDGHYYDGRTCIWLKGDSYDVRYYDRTSGKWYFNGVEYRFAHQNLNLGTISQWFNSYQYLPAWRNEASSTEDLYFKVEGGTETGYKSFAALRNSIPSLPLPPNGVIYVDGQTGNGPHDMGSGFPAIAGKYNPSMGNVFVSGQLDGKLTIASANDIFITGHDPCDWRHPDNIPGFNGATYPGVTYSNTTFQNIMDGDDFLYTEVGGDGDDMLGIIAKRQIRTIHWNWPSQISYKYKYLLLPTPTDNFAYNWGQAPQTFNASLNLAPRDTAPTNMYINAALFAIDESFGYETNWTDLWALEQTLGALLGSFEIENSLQPKDTLTMFGSVAQNFRQMTDKPPEIDFSIDFQTIAGYKQSYAHDPRMENEMPPHFLDPANSGWESIHWEEVTTHIPS